MDELTLGLLFILIGAALPCIVLGFLVAVKQKRSLIAGWDEKKISNPQAFARLVGYSVLVLGVLLALIGFAWYAQLIDEIGMSIAIFLTSLIPLPCIAIAHKKYRKRKC